MLVASLVPGSSHDGNTQENMCSYIRAKSSVSNMELSLHFNFICKFCNTKSDIFGKQMILISDIISSYTFINHPDLTFNKIFIANMYTRPLSKTKLILNQNQSTYVFHKNTKSLSQKLNIHRI